MNLSANYSLSFSYLYQLPLIRSEPYQPECLTSFVTRLAEAHCVSVSQLISKTITPQLEKIFLKNASGRDLKSLFNRSRALNAHGIMAEDFIQALERLTLHGNLSFLTLSTWKNVFIFKGLLRDTKAWCPLCYQKWLISKQEIYEPLLWTISEVEICHIHQTPLQKYCPHCFREIPWLTWHIRLGYCSNCGFWLGNSSYQQHNTTSLLNSSSWDLWIAETVGELLAFTPNLSSLPTQTHVKQAIFKAINQVTEGNIAAFSTLLNTPKNTVWGWYNGKNFPSLQALLQISYLLKISLKDFLTQELDFFNFIPSSNSLFLVSKNKQRSSCCVFDENQVEIALSNALAQPINLVPSIQQIASNLGLNRRLITRHFPDLCKALVTKRRQYQHIRHLQTIDRCCEEVQEATRILYQRGEYPTEQSVALLLSKPSYLRYKQVRKAFQQARHALGLMSQA